MEIVDTEEYVSNYVGIINLAIFVERAGVYRVEAELLHNEGYLDIREIMYLSCDRKTATMAALEVVIERATTLYYKELVLGKTTEPELRSWVRERNECSRSGDFDLHIHEVAGVLRESGMYLDSYRVESLHFPIKENVPPQILTKTPVGYKPYLNYSKKEAA